MNDFTKEELEKLLLSLIKSHDCYDHMHKVFTDQLAFKIFSLINNYNNCDHSNLDTNFCYKCGERVT